MTEKTVDKVLLDAFEELKNFKFRVVKSPLTTTGDHLQLLTWFIRNCETRDWIGTQHCDLIWTQPFRWDQALQNNYFTYVHESVCNLTNLEWSLEVNNYSYSQSNSKSQVVLKAKNGFS